MHLISRYIDERIVKEEYSSYGNSMLIKMTEGRFPSILIRKTR